MAGKELPVDDQIKLLLDENHIELCEPNPEEESPFPPWYDEQKYKRGQKYMQDNIFAQFTVTLSGLITVFAIPSILKILVNTHKSSNPDTAFKRYLSTIFHVYSWYFEELKPGTKAWKSLHAVRTRHFKASKSSKIRGGHQISQRDMAVTQFAFLAVGLLEPEKVGMRCDNQEDIEAYVHFWRTIGYMLGITDEYNICRSSLTETKKLFEVVRREIYCYHLLHPPEYFYHMACAALKGVWYFNFMISEGSFLYYTMWLFNVKGYDYDQNKKKFYLRLLIDGNDSTQGNLTTNNNMIKDGRNEIKIIEKELGWYNRFTLYLLHFGSNFFKSDFGKIYLNGQINLSIFLLNNFPFLSFWHFGWRGAFVNMFVEDVAVYTEPMTNLEVFSTTNF